MTVDRRGAEAGDVGEAEAEDAMMADMIVEKNGTVIEVGAVMRTTMVDAAGAGVAVGMEVDMEETDSSISGFKHVVKQIFRTVGFHSCVGRTWCPGHTIYRPTRSTLHAPRFYVYIPNYHESKLQPRAH